MGYDLQVVIRTIMRTKKTRDLVMDSVSRIEEDRHDGGAAGREIGSSGSVVYGGRSASRMEESQLIVLVYIGP